MHNNINVKYLLEAHEKFKDDLIEIQGWIRTFRESKNVSFIQINDGSTILNLQVILEELEDRYIEEKKYFTTGTSIKVTGKLKHSSGKGQNIELVAEKINIMGKAEDYPIQPKKHTLEFLRSISHLRLRTNTYSAVFRIKSQISYAIHKFFIENNFFYVQTPIITGVDAEGAGEMFNVSTLHDNKQEVDYSNDFFGEKVNLTVSGQLAGETAALALGKIYTFGPTFRAENSNTSRHLAEFWMVEPEVAFYNLNENIALAEKFLKYIIEYILKNSKEDLDFLDSRFESLQKQKPLKDRQEVGLREKLEIHLANKYEKISYTEAFNILKNSPKNKKKKFKFIVDKWGLDFQSEHEKYLTEMYFKKPVVITNFPKNIKAFYMYVNEDDKTVSAMDVLVPGIGEIIGGSQREHRLKYLLQRIQEMNIDKDQLSWYLDTRKFGSVLHSGFGLGLERLVQYITGMENIRDVILYPRTPGKAEC